MNKDQVQIINTMDKALSAFKALQRGTNSFTTSGKYTTLLVHFRISFNSKNTLLSKHGASPQKPQGLLGTGTPFCITMLLNT